MQLVDGLGGRGSGVVVAVPAPDLVEVEVRTLVVEPAPAPWLVVVQALPKGDRGALAVETMTEVGVDEVVPWAATRCVTRWRPGRADSAVARWRTTAVGAAKQSRRARFPVIAQLATTAVVADRLAACTAGVLLAETAAAPLSGWVPPVAGEVVLVVGPEGGLTAEELTTFEAAGAAAYRLGPTVLRSSTAGTAALAVLLARTPRWS